MLKLWPWSDSDVYNLYSAYTYVSFRCWYTRPHYNLQPYKHSETGAVL